MAAISSGTVSVPESGPNSLAPPDRMLKKELRRPGGWPQELGRTPTESDLAEHLGVSGDELRQAQRAEMAVQLYSLDAPLAGQAHMGTIADVLGVEDPRMEHMLDLEGTRAYAGPAPAPRPPAGRASATSANRLYGGRLPWSCASFAIS